MTIAELDQLRIDQATYVVIDFETVTPKGRPPEPIELGALRICPGLQVDPQFTFDMLIRPPQGAPVTPFDTAQTGIRWEDVENAPVAADVLNEFESILKDSEYILVAQNARYEASIIRRFSNVCKHVANMPFVDTVTLAKYVAPALPNYKLDTLAKHFSVTPPAQRHRALPDVEMTVDIFLRLLEIGRTTGEIMRVADLRQIAGVQTQVDKKISKRSLFD